MDMNRMVQTDLRDFLAEVDSPGLVGRGGNRLRLAFVC